MKKGCKTCLFGLCWIANCLLLVYWLCGIVLILAGHESVAGFFFSSVYSQCVIFVLAIPTLILLVKSHLVCYRKDTAEAGLRLFFLEIFSTFGGCIGTAGFDTPGTQTLLKKEETWEGTYGWRKLVAGNGYANCNFLLPLQVVCPLWGVRRKDKYLNIKTSHNESICISRTGSTVCRDGQRLVRTVARRERVF